MQNVVLRPKEKDEDDVEYQMSYDKDDKGNPKAIDLHITSESGYTEEQLLSIAINNLIDKLVHFANNIVEVIINEDVTELYIDGDTHTLGSVIQQFIMNSNLRKHIKSCGYSLVHVMYNKFILKLHSSGTPQETEDELFNIIDESIMYLDTLVKNTKSINSIPKLEMEEFISDKSEDKIDGFEVKSQHLPSKGSGKGSRRMQVVEEEDNSDNETNDKTVMVNTKKSLLKKNKTIELEQKTKTTKGGAKKTKKPVPVTDTPTLSLNEEKLTEDEGRDLLGKELLRASAYYKLLEKVYDSVDKHLLIQVPRYAAIIEDGQSKCPIRDLLLRVLLTLVMFNKSNTTGQDPVYIVTDGRKSLNTQFYPDYEESYKTLMNSDIMTSGKSITLGDKQIDILRKEVFDAIETAFVKKTIGPKSSTNTNSKEKSNAILTNILEGIKKSAEFMMKYKNKKVDCGEVELEGDNIIIKPPNWDASTTKEKEKCVLYGIEDRLVCIKDCQITMKYSSRKEYISSKPILYYTAASYLRYSYIHLGNQSLQYQYNVDENGNPKDNMDNTSLEAFSTPFNRGSKYFFTAYYDIDKYLGSSGEYFNTITNIIDEKVSLPDEIKTIMINPVFIIPILERVVYSSIKLGKYLSHINKDYGISLILPQWDDLDNNMYRQFEIAKNDKNSGIVVTISTSMNMKFRNVFVNIDNINIGTGIKFVTIANDEKFIE